MTCLGHNVVFLWPEPPVVPVFLNTTMWLSYPNITLRTYFQPHREAFPKPHEVGLLPEPNISFFKCPGRKKSFSQRHKIRTICVPAHEKHRSRFRDYFTICLAGSELSLLPVAM